MLYATLYSGSPDSATTTPLICKTNILDFRSTILLVYETASQSLSSV
jgi:hypothetical protein